MKQKLLPLLLLLGTLSACEKDKSESYSVRIKPITEVTYDAASDKTAVTVYATYSGDLSQVKDVGFMRSLKNQFDNYLFSFSPGQDRQYLDPLYDTGQGATPSITVIPCGENEMSITFSNLTKDLVFYTKAYIFPWNGEKAVYSDQISFVSSIKPLIEDQTEYENPANFTATTALLKGKIFSNGGNSVTEYGIYIGTENPPQTKIKGKNLDAEGNFTITARDLDGATKYYVSHYAANNNGESVTDVTEFTTHPYTEPAIAFEDPAFTSVVPTYIETSAQITDFGGDPNASYGIKYGTASGALDQTVLGTSIDADGKFTVRITPLEPNTAYYFAPFIQIRNHEPKLGEEKSQSTSDLSAPITETQSLIPGTDYQSTTITLKGHIVSDGGKPVTEAGFYWGEEGQGQTKISVATEDIEDGVFTKTLTTQDGITQLTKYTFRAYAVNEEGESENTDDYTFSTGIPDKFTYQYGIDATQTPYKYKTAPNKDANGKDIELHYFPLDPVKVTVNGENKTFIFLDRNLGATKRATSTEWDKDAIGYYFKWGRERHQVDPSMLIDLTSTVTVMSGPQPEWGSDDDKTGWLETNNPCPEGFSVPSSDEWNAFIQATSASNINKLNEKIYACVSGDWLGNNAAITNPTICYFWTFTHVPTEVKPGGTVSNPQANFVQSDSSNSTIAKTGRKRCKPIRCAMILPDTQ